jgi:arylsulfatase A
MKFIAICVLMTLLTVRSALAGGVPNTKPNIVFIMSDDQDYWNLECYGDGTSKSPNIRALAEGGRQFTRASTACPVCGPARVNVLTSHFLSRFKDYPINATSRFPADIPNVAGLLNNAGYRTGFTGKIHFSLLNSSVPNSDAAAKVAEIGFHEIGNAHNYVDTVGVHFETEPANFEFAKDFVRQSADTNFALFIWPTPTHGPFEAPQEFIDSVADFGGTVRDAMLTWMDRDIGQLVATIDSLGIRENTLIIYTTDNATTPQPSSVGFENRKTGNKGTVWDEWVPFIANWPGQIEAGSYNHDIIQNIDYLPTFLELAGAPVSLTDGFDGTSFAPLLFGNTCERPSAFFMEYGHARAVRTSNWKYIAMREIDEGWGFITQLKDYGNNTDLLFDMATDSLQHNNLADDPLYADSLAAMQSLLAEHMKTFDFAYGEFTEGAQTEIPVLPLQNISLLAEYRVYNVQGRQVASFSGPFHGKAPILGQHRKNLSTGVYLVGIQVKGNYFTRKTLIVR